MENRKDGPTYTFTVPRCTSLKINAIMGDDPAPKLAISQYGAVSFSSTYPLDFTGQPVQAYIVTEDKGSSFAKQQVYKVPAETGLVVEGEEGTYKIPIAKTTSFDDVSSNMLLSTATAAFRVPDDGKGYYGLHVHEKVLQRGAKVTGATVHFVDEDLDHGPILLQKAVEVREGDTPEVLQRRVMEEAEWILLPEAISLIAQGRVTIDGNGLTHIADTDQ